MSVIDDIIGFSGSVGDVLGSMSQNIGQAAIQQQEQYIKYIQAQVDADNPNLDYKTSVSVLGSDQTLDLNMSVPLVALMDGQIPKLDDLTAKFSMNVDSTTNSEDSLDGSFKGAGDASVGWGPFKAKIHLEGGMSKHSASKRSTDERATVDFEAHWGLHPVSEGFSRINDEQLTWIDMGIQVNKALAGGQIEKVAKSVGVGVPATAGGGADQPAQ